MNTRKIADIDVGVIGFGALKLDEYPPMPEDEALALLGRVVAADVTLIDTADVYGLGRNETLIGKALSQAEKERVLIATKAGYTRPNGYGWAPKGDPEHIKKAITGSLERLGLQQVQLYQLHCLDPDVPLRASVGAIRDLQEQGLVRHIGLSQVRWTQKFGQVAK